MSHRRVRLRMVRAAVVADDRRTDQQPGDLEVPHHPARAGVPEECIVGTDIRLQRNGFQMLEHDAAVPVHDSLRQPRGARREQNPQRMVEIDRDRVQFIGVGLRGELRCQHGGPQRRQAGLQRGDVVALVVGLAAVPIAVGGDEDDRLELAEPVQRRLSGIVLPAGAPDGADARGGEERDDRLGDVGQITHHTVTCRHAVRTQRLRECGSAPRAIRAMTAR